MLLPPFPDSLVTPSGGSVYRRYASCRSALAKVAPLDSAACQPEYGCAKPTALGFLADIKVGMAGQNSRILGHWSLRSSTVVMPTIIAQMSTAPVIRVGS